MRFSIKALLVVISLVCVLLAIWRPFKDAAVLDRLHRHRNLFAREISSQLSYHSSRYGTYPYSDRGSDDALNVVWKNKEFQQFASRLRAEGFAVDAAWDNLHYVNCKSLKYESQSPQEYAVLVYKIDDDGVFVATNRHHVSYCPIFEDSHEAFANLIVGRGIGKEGFELSKIQEPID